MKLILLYLAVVLCTVCKATSVRGRAGLGTYSRFGLGVLLSGKKTLSAKNSGGNKDDSVSAGGKENSNDALRLGLDGAASVNTNLDASATHRVGGSGSSTTPQKDERSPFDLIKAILRLQGATSGSSKLSVHSTNDPSAEPGDDPTAQGPQATASSTPKQNVDTNLSSAGSATSNDGASPAREQSSADPLMEESQNLGNESPTETSGSGSGKGGSSAETGSSRGRGRGSGNGLMLQDQPAPASGRNDKTVDTSGLSTESAISNEENLSGSGDSNKVSGPSSSAVVSTDSGDDGNLEDKQVPRFNGDERDGENNSDFFGAGSLDTGNTSDSGSHNLSSGSGSSVRSNVSIGAGPSDQNESADLGGSGRVTCAGKTVSGASSVA